MRITLSSFAPVQVQHGLKTGLATALAYFVTRGFELDNWQWAVVAAVIAMQATVAEAIQSAVNQIIGTMLGAAFGIALLYLLPPGMVWLGVFLFGGTAVCASLSRYSNRFTMAALTVAVVLLAGTNIAGKQAIMIGLSRMMEITIGVSAAMLVAITVWPVSLARALRRDLAEQYQECAFLLNQIVQAFLNRQQSVAGDILDRLLDKTWSNHEQILRVRKHEAVVYQYDHGVLTVQVRALDRAVKHLRPMLETLTDYEEPGYDVIMAPEIRNLADAVMAALRHVGGSTPAAPAPDIVRSLTRLVDQTETRLGVLRDSGVTNRLNLHELIQFFTFFHSLRGMATDLLLALDSLHKPIQSGISKGAK